VFELLVEIEQVRAEMIKRSVELQVYAGELADLGAGLG
jgi:hypothetical protein